MSFYNHVANKEEILDGLVELVVSEIEVPTLGGDWKAAMGRHDGIHRLELGLDLLLDGLERMRRAC